jgi:hypothetical protein
MDAVIYTVSVYGQYEREDAGNAIRVTVQAADRRKLTVRARSGYQK